MRDVSAKPATIGVGAEFGATNPHRAGSTLYEDFLPQLRGPRAALLYEEMAWNDATIGSIVYTVEQLSRQVKWHVESDSEATEQFLDLNVKGLTSSWDDFISAALSELVYGWSMFEVVYRMEAGKIWWHKFGFRNQSSLVRWILDDAGELEAMVQSKPGGAPVVIPVEKLIHFRTTTGEGRPEGRSWLRRIYRSWHIKKYVEDQTAIGVSRDLVGTPMMTMPAAELFNKDGDAYATVKKIVTRVKVDEQAGLMIPSDVDPDTGEPLYKFELLSTSGRPKVDALAYIRSLAQDIAAVMLAQFIGLGRDTVGSRALAEPQQELFQTALVALLDSIEEQFHRQATVKLLELNGLAPGRIKHGPVKDIDMDAITTGILRISQAGADPFAIDERTGEPGNPELLNQLFAMMGVETDAPTIEGD